MKNVYVPALGIVAILLLLSATLGFTQSAGSSPLDRDQLEEDAEAEAGIITIPQNQRRERNMTSQHQLTRRSVLPAEPELMQKLQLADEMLANGSYDEAEQMYLEIIDQSEADTGRNRNFSEAYNNLAVCYYRKGELETASNYFEDAIERSQDRAQENPSFAPNHIAMGNLALLEFYLSSRVYDPAESEQHLQQCFEWATECLSVRDNYTRAYQALGLYAWKKAWRQSSSYDPAQGSSYQTNYYYRIFDSNEADSIIEKFQNGLRHAESDRQRSDLMVNLGFVYIALDQREDARQMAYDALNLDPSNPYCYALKGFYYQHFREENEFPHAIELYKQGLELTPETDPLLIERFYYNIACCYAIMNYEQKVYEYLRLAAEQGYRDFDYMENDKDFYNINFYPEFKELIDEFRQEYSN